MSRYAPQTEIMRVAVRTETADHRWRDHTLAFSSLEWRTGKQYVLHRVAEMLEEACVSMETETQRARAAGPAGRLP